LPTRNLHPKRNYTPKKPKRLSEKSVKPEPGNPSAVQGIRLNKFIANSGICSRREADELITQGLIMVNGKTITTLGIRITLRDKITYQGKILKNEKPVYVLLNKPKDYITSVSDPEDRKTVMELVKKACSERIYPVGRLDRNTTGLLLLTNDGELAEKLAHPSNQIRKIYEVRIDQPIRREDIEKLRKGINLDDGPISVDDIAIVSPDYRSLGIELHSGRNRIIRRIFESLGYRIVNLDRVVYANLTKKDLPRGKWRHLTQQEVIRLKYLNPGKNTRSTPK
jgi:23S rRNA pseudouridine2605 synthase